MFMLLVNSQEVNNKCENVMNSLRHLKIKIDNYKMNFAKMGNTYICLGFSTKSSNICYEVFSLNERPFNDTNAKSNI